MLRITIFLMQNNVGYDIISFKKILFMVGENEKNNS